MCLVMVARTSLFVTCSIYEMLCVVVVFKQFIFTAWIVLCSSAVSVHVSHAYRKTNRISACKSFSLDERLTLLSLHVSYSFASAVIVSAALAIEPQSLSPHH